jgi:hypothetical protein
MAECCKKTADIQAQIPQCCQSAVDPKAPEGDCLKASKADPSKTAECCMKVQDLAAGLPECSKKAAAGEPQGCCKEFSREKRFFLPRE